ncbi:MAG TPA: HPF/RaiA family ribosome-associated protein [Acidimicrobiia bacterium]
MSGESRDQLATDISSGVVYQTVGLVPTSARVEAEEMVSKLSDFAPRPVLFARVRVKNDEDRDPDQCSVVEGTMDVSGAVIRAQAAGPTAIDALRVVGNKLERRLTRLAAKRQRATKRPPSTPTGEWRSGDLPSDRPEFYDRPPEERQVVRRKTYSPADRLSVSEALFDLDVLDHRFFLFTDAADEKPSIVYEEDDRVALRKIDGSKPDEARLRPGVQVSRTPAPTITVEDAVSRLNLSGMPFVFFRDAESRSASVLYRRYDGHYGLIVPSTASD